MASAFGHAFFAISIGTTYPAFFKTPKFWILGIVCSILPDADVLAFHFGIPYDHFWGHRGFTHSILFALISGALFTVIFYRKRLFSKAGILLITFFFLCTLSHSLLDAMTNGGLGVALFSPWDNARYFFPWRPIQVSPIGVENFFSEWGKRVILSELIWIGIPGLLLALAGKLIKRTSKKNVNAKVENKKSSQNNPTA